MNYNAIQMREAIDKLIDRVKSPRFSDDRYYEAINQAQKLILDDRIEPIKQKKDYSVQTTERLRNELASLIPATASLTIAGDLVTKPADYYYLLSMQNTVNGVKNACRPLTYNETGVINRNPFRRPKSAKTYYNEYNAGWAISLPAATSFTLCELDYIKVPDTVSIGKEKDKITTSGLLVIGTSYTVYNQAVHNGVIYYEGESFTALSPSLTSGVVLPTSVITNSDMPDYLHEEIVRFASAILMGTVEDYTKYKFLRINNEAE